MNEERERGSRGLASRLRAARASRGLTQAALSLHVGADRKTCYHIERGAGTGNSSLVLIERMAEVLQVSPGWLAYGEEDDGPARLASEPQRRLSAHGDDGSPEDDPAAEADLGEPPTPWPWSYRAFGLDYEHLPPLGLRYGPVIKALGPWLPQAQREAASRWLTTATFAGPKEERRAAVAQLRDLLHILLSERQRAAVDLVMGDLESEDWSRRARMALSLLVDAGLPARCAALLPLWKLDPPQSLRGALGNALEILEHGEWAFMDAPALETWRLGALSAPTPQPVLS